MGHSIAVMNAKGGVGKSTLTMAMAEVLALEHGKRILLIDSDGQMSLSLMVTPFERLRDLRGEGRSLASFLVHSVLHGQSADWRNYLAHDVSDVDDVRDIYLLPGDMDITLVERSVVAAGREAVLAAVVQRLLVEASSIFDLVIVDCAPGITTLTECWLRACDYHLVPVKPDVLAVAGMEYLRNFKAASREADFAQHIGVVVNMMDETSDDDRTVYNSLRARADLRCFPEAVPRLTPMQRAALFSREPRSLIAKYPSSAGRALRAICQEMLHRISGDQAFGH
ncbi:MAG: ParA family protein [Hyphomicrobiaceae bacterium]